MATDNAAAAAPLSMKLLIDTSAQRLLFAEASKDVVDFLFSLLSLPVGTAVTLLGEDSMVGCISNLYASVEDLDGTYLQPGAAKDALLNPVVLSTAASANSSIFRLPAPSPARPKAVFACSSCYSYLTDTGGTKCPGCTYGTMNKEKQFVSPPGSGGQAPVKAAANVGGKGFVQGIVTYTVMD